MIGKKQYMLAKLLIATQMPEEKTYDDRILGVDFSSININ